MWKCGFTIGQSVNDWLYFRLHLLLRKKVLRHDIGRDTIGKRIVEPLDVRGGGDVTQLLVMAREGDREAMDRLLPLVYAELRRVAFRFGLLSRGEFVGYVLER